MAAPAAAPLPSFCHSNVVPTIVSWLMVKYEIFTITEGRRIWVRVTRKHARHGPLPPSAVTARAAKWVANQGATTGMRAAHERAPARTLACRALHHTARNARTCDLGLANARLLVHNVPSGRLQRKVHLRLVLLGAVARGDLREGRPSRGETTEHASGRPHGWAARRVHGAALTRNPRSRRTWVWSSTAWASKCGSCAPTVASWSSTACRSSASH